MNLNNKNLLKNAAYIDGSWVSGTHTFDVLNPANGLKVGEVPDMGTAETKLAIEVAEQAMPDWAALTAKARAVVLRKWADLMVANADDLAMIMTAEQGKPLAESKGEVIYGASFLEWFGEEGKRAYGETIPSPIANARILTIKQPVGVCAAITPWNFPSAMITRKVGPALAAGCSVVCKPAEDTPLSALALAVLAEEAGVPAAVFNVVTTSDAATVGKELCDNPIVRKLSFTGSTEVGKILMAQCAGTMKKLSLELGGNAPFIVFDDADIDAAVEGAVICKYRNAGQTCVSANRFFVQEGVYDEFADKLAAKVKDFKVGDGAEEGTVIGPLINLKAVEKVKDHVKDAISKGGEIILGGGEHSLGGTFFEPTVVKNVTTEMKFSQEETFGPLAPLFKFKNEKEAISLSNSTKYGLAAYFYSRDIGRVWRVAEALEFGMVAVNTGILSTEVAPFGGIKESGVGREGSKYGLDEYLEIKYILMAD
ncbi:MAG: NAD-dependent succinate-semialdehyde dehydrogenase [Micavibrio sp.]|nr:MAG: NAD-dependent succinate-semialdehyde dehydrogenase [Micavibrio sp.]